MANKKITDLGAISISGSTSSKVLGNVGGTLGWVSSDEFAAAVTEDVQAVLEEAKDAVESMTASGVTYAEELYAYGVQWDVTASSPTCTRIGNTTYHKTLPVQSLMKGGLMDDDGNFTPFNDQTDWTQYDRSGESGQVMVRIPAHYRKAVMDGDTRELWLSLVAIEGYTYIPEMYISAYEAALDRTNLKLCSVVNEDEQYVGGGGSSDESSYAADDYTLCGCPATNITVTNYRTYARNRGTGVGLNGYGWNMYTYNAHKALLWLFVVEYATRNSQLGYNAELTDDGYHQGGLGAGVTAINGTYWSSWNNYNPFIPCGYTDELGNTTGVVSFDMPSGYLDAAGLESLTVSVPRYRGIENPFGHIWKKMDGAIAYGTDNQLYTCDDPSLFSSTSYDDYTYKGTFSTNSNVYVKDILFGEDADYVATETGGGSTTYWCDNAYTSATDSLRGLVVGALAYSIQNAGLACVHSASSFSSSTGRNRGSRLCFFPA